MSWHDPQNPMPTEGYGKFELNVHSNDCYTAGGPSKLTGFLTLTDKAGKEVTNPLFEFDSCFDPHGDTSPTGHRFPSVVGVLGSSVNPDAQGKAGVQLSCGTGAGGCAGTVKVTAGGTNLGVHPLPARRGDHQDAADPDGGPGRRQGGRLHHHDHQRHRDVQPGDPAGPGRVRR